MNNNGTTLPITGKTTTVAYFNVTVTLPPTVSESETYNSSTTNITSTNCCSESYTQQNFNFSTTTLTTDVETSTEPTEYPVTESVHKFQVCLELGNRFKNYTIICLQFNKSMQIISYGIFCKMHSLSSREKYGLRMDTAVTLHTMMISTPLQHQYCFSTSFLSFSS